LIPLLAKALKAERAVLASEGHSQTIRKAALKSHRLAVALDTARAELQQAIRLRDEFLSIASHELKTPITGMLLGTEMLKLGLYKSNEGFFSQEMIAKLVDQTSHGLEQLNRLVEDMLDISRIQAGKLRLRKERIDLCRLVRSTVERYQSQLQSAGIKTRIEASSSPEVFADPFKIEQVITNFITNAIRYAPNGPLNITISQGGGTAKVIFQDSGPGIPPENHAKVFQRFERLVSANEVSGMGLGLYIVKEIIEAHGGRVVLHSELGKGAAFVMILPSEIMEQRHEA
jgi:signal transduction histidine kinase